MLFEHHLHVLDHLDFHYPIFPADLYTLESLRYWDLPRGVSPGLFAQRTSLLRFVIKGVIIQRGLPYSKGNGMLE